MTEGLLDWRRAAVREPQPCVLCGRPAILRHPENPRTPIHKVCSDTQQRAVTR